MKSFKEYYLLNESKKDKEHHIIRWINEPNEEKLKSMISNATERNDKEILSLISKYSDKIENTFPSLKDIVEKAKSMVPADGGTDAAAADGGDGGDDGAANGGDDAAADGGADDAADAADAADDAADGSADGADDADDADDADTREPNEDGISRTGMFSDEDKEVQTNKILNVIRRIRPVTLTNTCKSIIKQINKFASDGKITDKEIKRAFAFSANDSPSNNTSEQLSYVLKIICLISLYNKNSKEPFFTGEGKIRGNISSIIGGNDIKNSIETLGLKQNFEADDLLSKTLGIGRQTSEEILIKALNDYSKQVIDSNKDELANKFRTEDTIKAINNAKNKEELEKIKNNIGETSNEEILKALKDKEESFAPAGGAAPDGSAPAGGAPVGGTPVGSAPAGGAPVGGAPVGGAPADGEDYSKYKREFDANYKDSEDTLKGKIIKYFGDDDAPGTALSRYLKKVEDKEAELKAKQQSLNQRKEDLNQRKHDLKEEEIIAEAIITKDYQILNEVNFKNNMRALKLKASNLGPRIGRSNLDSTRSDNSWNSYKEKLKNFEEVYRNKAFALLDSSRWDTAPIKTRQKICYKLNLLSADLIRDLKITYDNAVKRNSYSELGAIKHDLKNASLNRKERNLDRYEDSREGRTRAIERNSMNSALDSFMENFNKLEKDDQNYLAYAIVYPNRINAKSNPADKKSKTIRYELEEMLRSDNNSATFGVGKLSNIQRWLTLLQKKFGNDETIKKLAALQQQEMNKKDVITLTDFMRNIASKLKGKIRNTAADTSAADTSAADTSAAGGGDIHRDSGEFDTDNNNTNNTNNNNTDNNNTNNPIGTAENFSVVTENILYRKYVLKEDIQQPENPLVTLMKGKDAPGYQEALERFATNYYKNLNLNEKEIKEKLPVIEAALENFKKNNPELAGNLSPQQQKPQMQQQQKPQMQQQQKPQMQQQRPQMQQQRPQMQQQQPIQTTVVTGDVGSGTIPDRLYKKIIRRKIGK